MKITLLGAAHQVTGSRTLVEWLPGRFFLVDCGMEQGENDYEMAQLMIDNGADLNAQSNIGTTPFIDALIAGKFYLGPLLDHRKNNHKS